MFKHHSRITLINIIFLYKTREADEGTVGILSYSEKTNKKQNVGVSRNNLKRAIWCFTTAEPQRVSPTYSLDGVSSDCLQTWITFDFTTDLLFFLITTGRAGLHIYLYPLVTNLSFPYLWHRTSHDLRDTWIYCITHCCLCRCIAMEPEPRA